MTQKLWGGRFQKPTSPAVEAFTSSLEVDGRLFAEDIAGSIAHARMLARQGIITLAEGRQIVNGLRRVYSDLQVNGPTGPFEDIHSLVEARLTELLGPVGGKLHTARSRNDQVALDLRLFARRALVEAAEASADLQEALLDSARAHVETLLPGYTHLQRAQPVRLAHHLLAYVAMLSRDLGRLQDCTRRVNVMPLGSGALAGAPYPIDRDFVAGLLGFPEISENSLDAVSDRDFVVEHVAALALVAAHCSRLCEELVLWSTAEFGFVEFDDAHATGSSIMPQKKNPDVAELIRGRTGRVVGALVDLLTVLKGLPLSYNRDLQEDKQAYFRAHDSVLDSVTLLAEVVRGLEFRADRMRQAANDPLLTATDLADHLARLGLPFREAHQVVGRIVTYCLNEGRSLRDLDTATLSKFSPLLAQSAPDLDPARSAEARDIPGGTSKRQIRLSLSQARRRVAAARRWAAVKCASLPDVQTLASLPWEQAAAKAR